MITNYILDLLTLIVTRLSKFSHLVELTGGTKRVKLNGLQNLSVIKSEQHMEILSEQLGKV